MAPMQSMSGNNGGTYMLYMFPLMAGMPGLPCWPCSEPWQLAFDDYQLVVAILGVLGMAPGTILSFSTRIFPLDLSGNRSGATILCLQHPLKVPRTGLTSIPTN